MKDQVPQRPQLFAAVPRHIGVPGGTFCTLTEQARAFIEPHLSGECRVDAAAHRADADEPRHLAKGANWVCDYLVAGVDEVNVRGKACGAGDVRRVGVVDGGTLRDAHAAVYCAVYSPGTARSAADC